MTLLQEAIRNTLNETGGNIKATAMRLGVSAEYVRKIVQSDKTNVMVARNEPLYKLLGATIEALQEKLESSQMPVTAMVKLLEALLRYDAQIQAMTRPLISVDNRSQVNMLIQQLDSMPTEDLKKLIIDAEEQSVRE